MKTENHREVNGNFSSLLESMTWKMFSLVMDAGAFVKRLPTENLFFTFPDDESDDIEANNNRNSPNASHRNGYSLENNESTDSSYKSYNNFNSNNRESNYHDNKNYDMHKKHR